MAERRYCGYQEVDVWAQLYHLQARLGVRVLDGTVVGKSVSLVRKGSKGAADIEYRAVILARSSDWYRYSLNCNERFRHGVICVVCGTHDSCLERFPVLALDSMKWYEPMEMRLSSLAPAQVDDKGCAHDAFDTRRKSQYGHNMLIGALMCQRKDALQRLQTLPPRTRYRIEAEVKRLHMRRVGRPVNIAPVYEHWTQALEAEQT